MTQITIEKADIMDNPRLIKELKNPKLIATCPCGEEFRLSDAFLFDGLGKVPPEAHETYIQMLDGLKQKTEELKKRKISADVGAEKKAMEVGIGKIIEKILPAYASFGIPVPDCRPLFEPIDMIAFRGLSSGKIDRITFMEIKTGASRLNKHQKMVKEAVEDGDVAFRRY